MATKPKSSVNEAGKQFSKQPKKIAKKIKGFK
jgi:hypothetical protein